MTQDVLTSGGAYAGDPRGDLEIPPMINLASDHAEVEPGQAIRMDVTVRNPSAQVESYDLTVLGPTAPWVTVSPQTLSLFPGEEATATLTIRPPMSSSVVAGSYYVGIRAMSHVSRERSASDEMLVEVAPFYRFETDISRSTFAVRTKAKTQVRVVNQGNSSVTYGVSALDPDGYLRISLPESTVTLVPGESLWIPILAKMAPRLFGTDNNIRTVTATITPLRNADTDAALIDEQPAEQRINILHRPFIRLRLGILARLVLLLGLLAIVAAFIYSRYAANQPPSAIGAPPVPSHFTAALTSANTPVLTWETSPGASGYTIYSVAHSADAPAPSAPPAATTPAAAAPSAPAAAAVGPRTAVFRLAADTTQPAPATPANPTAVPSMSPSSSASTADLGNRPLPICEGCTEVASVDGGTTRYVVEKFTTGENCWRISATVDTTQSLYSPETCVEVPAPPAPEPTTAAVDTNGDGTPDSIDTNGDGTPDTPAVDTNGDGTPDAAAPAPAPIVAPCPPAKVRVKVISPTSLAVLWKPAVKPPLGMSTPEPSPSADAAAPADKSLKLRSGEISKPVQLAAWTGNAGAVVLVADTAATKAAESPESAVPAASASASAEPDPLVCDPAKKVTGWTVQRKIFSGWSDVTPEPKADDTAIEISDLDPDRKYCFRLRAKAADADSVYTDKTCIRTPPLPVAEPSASAAETFTNPGSTSGSASSSPSPTPTPSPSAGA